MNMMLRALRAVIWAVILAGGVMSLPQAAEAQPSFSKVFSPDTIGPGGTSTLTFTITNGSGSPATALDFTDNLPAAVSISSTPDTTNTCTGGTLSAPAGGGTISYTGGAVGGGTSCTVSVNVTASTAGTHTNTTGDLTSSQGNSGTATDDLTVSASTPGFSKSFAPSTITLGARTTLTYTIDNTASATTANGMVFTHNLPGGLVVASPANAVNTCSSGMFTGGTFNPVPGGSTVALEFGSGFNVAAVAAGATCTLSVDITGAAVGIFNSVTGDLTGSFSNAGPAVSTLTVTGGDRLQITKAFTDDPVAPGSTATLEFTLRNNDRTFPATGVAFSDDLDAMLSGAAFSGPALFNDCGGMGGGTGLFSYSGATIAPEGSCTIRIPVSIPAGAGSGNYVNTTSTITGTIDGAPVSGGAASDTLFVSGGIPSLTKTFTTPSITAGSPATMEFTITNPSGTSAMTDLSFTDNISSFLSGATVTGGTGAGVCGAGSNLIAFDSSGDLTLQLIGGNLAVSGSCTFSVTLSTPANTPGGTYPNTTSQITGTAGGGSVVGPAASDSLVVNGGINLQFSKSFTSGTANAGDTATLEFVIDNSASLTTVTGLAFADDLASMGLPGIEFASATANTCGGMATGGFPTTNFGYAGGSVTGGGTCRIELVLNVPAGAATGDYTNTSDPLTGDGGVGDAPAQAVLSVLGVDDQPVNLSKEFIGGPFLPGETATLRFTIDNPNATSDATAIFFTDDLDANLPGLAATALPATPCGAGSSITGTNFLIFVGGEVAAGAPPCVFDVTVQVPGAATSGSYGNTTSSVTATVNGNATVGDPASAVLEVESSQLEITKTFVDPLATAGALARMEITVTNTTSGVLNATYTDDLNAMLPGTVAGGNGFVGCSGGQFVAGSGTSNLTVTISNLPAGESCTHRFLVQPPSGAVPGSYTNTISDLSGTVGGLAITGPTATASLRVRAVDAPVFSSAFAPAVSAATQTTTLNLTIQNKSTGAISDLAFTNDLDAMLTGAVATGLPTSVCGGTLSGTSFLTFSGGSLAGSASCTIPVTVQIPATAAAGSYSNTTSDLSQNGLSVAPATSASLAIEPPPTFDKGFGTATLRVPETTTLTFTIDNSASALAATGLSFSDPFPAGLAVANPPNASSTCSGGMGNATAGATSFSYAGGTVGAGATCTVQIDVAATAAGTPTNTTGDLTSSNGNSGTASAGLTILPEEVDVSVTKTDGLTSIRAGETLTYTMVVANAGPSDDPSVSFSDTFPAQLTCSTTSVAAGGASGNTAAGAGDLAETLALPAGSSVTYTASCLVAADASGTLSNTATATPSITDTAPGNNSATDGDTVVVEPVLGFAKAFSPAVISQGETSTLTFTIDNSANALPADNMRFDDGFPPGMVVASPANVVNGCGGDFSANPGEPQVGLSNGALAIGAVCTIAVDVRGTGSGVLDNLTETLRSTLPDAAGAAASLTVNPAGAPLFTKAFGVATLDQGATTTLTFTIDNSANAIEATSLVFSDPLPAGLVLADPVNAANSCNGTLTANPGETQVVFSGGDVAAGGTCTIEVDVRAAGDSDVTNTTSALTSSLPSALPAVAALAINPAGAPVFTKSFTPDAVEQGETTVMRLNIDNTANALAGQTMAFTDDFPAGLAVADPANLTSDCGGTVTANAGETTVSLADGAVAAGGSCAIEVTVRVTAAADVTNTTSALSSTTLPAAAAASATLTVTPATVPGFAKSFAPSVISQGETSTLTFTIDNRVNAIAATDLAFSDDFPAGMVLASPVSLSNSCGGTVTANAGDATMSLAGGTLAENASCEIAVTVQGLTAGSHANTTSALDTSLGTAAAASATLTVNALPLDVAMGFAPATIEQFQSSVLTYSFTNLAQVAATGLTLSDSLPGDVTLATPANASSTCGGSLTAADGGNSVALSGGMVAAGGTCTVSVTVSSGVVGSYANSTESVTSSLGSSAAAQATLRVDPATTGTLTIVQNTDTDGAYVFSSATPALNFTINTAGGTGQQGPVTLPMGSHVISQATPDGVGNTAIRCTDNDSVGQPRERTLTVNIGALENVTCTFTSIATRQKTVDTINRFLTKRADLILSSEPSNSRRINRLKRGAGGSTALRFANGDLNSFLPFTAQISTTSDSYTLSTSFLQMQQAAASLALAHGDQRGVRHIPNYRWDAWFEAQYKKFDAGTDSGHFAIAYFGADYLVNENILVGAMFQVDDMEDDNATLSTSVSGTGWMVGPYMTARLAPNLYFDGRVAVGTSQNDISPFNTYVDAFTTDRWMAMAGITGDFQQGNWTIQPGASLSYFEETQNAYVDSLGVGIPSQTVALGQIKIGPTISGQFQTESGMGYAPYMSLDAIYNFGDTKGVTVTNPDSAVTDGWRGRVQAGVDLSLKNGASISFGGSYDGIGRDSLEVWGANLKIEIPIQKAKAR